MILITVDRATNHAALRGRVYAPPPYSTWFCGALGSPWVEAPLYALFNASPWQTRRRDLRLREDGKDGTDIDLALFEPQIERRVLSTVMEHPLLSFAKRRHIRPAGTKLLKW